MQVTSNFPIYKVSETHTEKQSILVLTKEEAELVHQLWRQDFSKNGKATHHQGKTSNVFLTPKQASKFTLTQNSFVEFSSGVQELSNYFGVASDILMSAYKFSRKQKPLIPPTISIKKDTKKIEQILKLVQSRNRSKEWANGRGDIEGTPQYFVNEVNRISKTYGLKSTVIQGDDLVTQGFRLLHAVGRASKNIPAFVNLSYNGNPDSDKWVAFVGKGVCFDSGGLDIKTAAGMKDMFLDKHGMTSVLSAFQTIVQEKSKINVTVSAGLVENFISSNSYRPSDIIKSRKGLTVQIGNTDAQGRLVLADAMHWTQQNYKVDCLIQLSTLTGAIISALGSRYAGMFGNNQNLNNALRTAGKIVNEEVWQLPVNQYHHDMMKGQKADLSSHPGKMQAGSSQAAAFLQNFVEEGTRWIHLDIAGSALVGGQGTGYGSRLLVQFARNYASQ